MNEDASINILLNKKSLIKHDMFFIDDNLTLNKKKFYKYINNYEDYLIVTTKRMRSDMLNLTIFIHRAKKRLRD